MSYKLVFADGTELDNLTMNGNTLISEAEVPDVVFNDAAMRIVTLIDPDGNETVYRYAQTNGAFHKESGWCFTVWGASPAEIEMRQLQEANDMLTECILEMSEIIYGE